MGRVRGVGRAKVVLRWERLDMQPDIYYKVRFFLPYIVSNWFLYLAAWTHAGNQAHCIHVHSQETFSQQKANAY